MVMVIDARLNDDSGYRYIEMVLDSPECHRCNVVSIRGTIRIIWHMHAKRIYIYLSVDTFKYIGKVLKFGARARSRFTLILHELNMLEINYF